ncbi:MAG: protein translocase subunit SecD [Candidatus Brocadiaceae bacterium]|nr:protein translocase subunit SecD [Candidatus Brocadiaceae bacterium]
MPKEILRWKMPLIVIVVALALLSLYPPTDRVIKKEKVKEVDGQVVERSTLEEVWLSSLLRDRTVREAVLKEETTPEGKRVKEKLVEYVARGRVKLGLDLRGGSELLYRVRVEPGQERPRLTQEVIDILKKRIDPKGIMEYRIQEQGLHRILIQVPGATKAETDALKDRIVRLGKLEFRMAAPKGSPEYQEADKGKAVPGYYKHWHGKKRGEVGKETEEWYLVRNKIEISGESLSRVYPDRKDIQPVVGFEFNTEGKAKFSTLTERNIGRPMAIILDGVLYSAPTIRERIPGKGIIEGNFTQDEVNNLIAVMRAGSLPADLEMEMEMSVGPSLGRDSIRNGLTAGLVGSALVVGFMAVYYLGSGLVANLALVLNILFVLGALAIMGATLTLPGIAGLVLMVGMAVDANVLIFERIREEKAKGKPIPLAMKTGYERAFTTIIDSNLTTLITALILYAVGTGPIKGFGIILSIGILVNLFTAVFVTRVVFELFQPKEFKMLRLFEKPSIHFMDYFKRCCTASVLLITVGLVAFQWRGIDKYDIDFTGGTLIHLQLARPTPVGEVRGTLAQLGYKGAEVQGVWTAGALVAEPTEFGIRIKGLSDDKTREKLQADFQKVLGERLEGVQFGKLPTALSLKLKKPMEETELRKVLAGAGYADEDIVILIPLGVSSREYELTVPALKNENARVGELEKLVQGVPGLAFQGVTLQWGELKEVETQTAPKGAMVGAQGTLGLELNNPIDPKLLEIELWKRGYHQVFVSLREERARKLTGTKLELMGPRGTLASMKGEMPRELRLPSFIFLTETSLRVGLENPLEEGALRATIQPGRLNVTRIMPLGAAAENFGMELNPLRAEKLQEKIKEDVISAFRDNLYRETIGVTFEKVSDADGETLASMHLGKPLSKNRIEGALSGAGYNQALAEPLEAGQDYRAVKLRVKSAEFDAMRPKLVQAFQMPDPLKRVVSIGSTVAEEMKNRAYLALIFANLTIIIYIWFRFGEAKFGVAAVIALVHDVLFTLGAVAVAGYFSDVFGELKLNLPMIAAFLALVGYSLNDTIVVFDRIRENMGGKKAVDAGLVNESVNQTLSRTVLTSLTVFFVVASLYFLGGSELQGFAFVMLVGVAVGTYSSIFIASPVLVHWLTVRRGFGLIFLALTAPLWLPWKVWKRFMGGTAHPRRA